MSLRLRAGLRLRSATGEGKPVNGASITLNHRKGENEDFSVFDGNGYYKPSEWKDVF